MYKKHFEAIAGSVLRSKRVAEMDKNQIRRQAKLKALSLVASDLSGTLKHECSSEYSSFNQELFLTACGFGSNRF